MAVNYDPNLVGVAIPNVPIGPPPPRNVRRETLKKMMNSINALQDTELDVSDGDNDKAIAFVKACELLKDGKGYLGEYDEDDGNLIFEGEYLNGERNGKKRI